MHCSPEPMRTSRPKRSGREYLPKPVPYIHTALPITEPKEPNKPKRKKVALSRHFAENFIAGLGFAGGVFVFAAIALWLIAGRL